MASYLVTGTSRGIGLELVRQLLQEREDKVGQILAVTRSAASKDLQALIDQAHGRVVNIVVEDITNEAITKKASQDVEKALKGKGLDVLVNNAGAADWTPGGVAALSADKLRDIFNSDVVSAHVVTATFLPLLKAGSEKKIINISTSMGSIALTKNFGAMPTPAYKIAKAAMNMLHAQYATDLAADGFTVLAITPGWLKTDLGSDAADLEPSVGVASVKEWILKASASDNGKFVNINVPSFGSGHYDGKEVPW